MPNNITSPFADSTLPYGSYCFENFPELFRHPEDIRCVYCFASMHYDDIWEWVDGYWTAMCPSCGIDALVPRNVLPISDEEAQEKLEHWHSLGFGGTIGGVCQ